MCSLWGKTTTQPPPDSLVYGYFSEDVREQVESWMDENNPETRYTVFVAGQGDLTFKVNVFDEVDVEGVSVFDGLIYNLILNPPSIEGDETYASIRIARIYLTEKVFEESLSAIFAELGFPSSTMARIENTRALDGTQYWKTTIMGTDS